MSYKRRYRMKKKRSWLKSKVFWIFVLVLVLVSGLGYFLFFSSVFQIDKIEISGTKKVAEDNLKKIIERSLPVKVLFWETKSTFLVRTEKIRDIITESFPKIDKAIIKRDLPGGLSFQIEERSPLADWCFEENCFYVDKKGIAFTATEEQSDIVIESGSSLESLSLGKEVIEEKKLASIEAIERELKDISIEKYFLSEKLTAKTSQGWEIYFSLEKDIEKQIFNLNLVLEEKIPQERRGDLQYIDLRFGNRIFVSPPLVDVIDED